MNGAEPSDAGGPVSLVDLIDALTEPPEPAPIPLTPQTWGWAALAVVAAALLALTVWRLAVRRRAEAYRRAALGELAEARDAAQVAAILRRAALAAWPREDVAALTGEDWTAFLDRTGRGNFPQKAALELRTAPYRYEAAPASTELHLAAEAWLRSHRVQRASAASGRPARAAA